MTSPPDRPDLRLYESALFRTVSSLIVGEDYLLLVDPTWLPGEVAAIHAEAEALLPGRQGYLLFTHSDYDHILGFGKFADWHTLASQSFVDHPDPEEVLREIREFDDQYYITRDHPVVYPRIDTAIVGEGTAHRLGSETYLFWQSPGHNADGLLVLHPQRGILIVGDYLSNVEFPYLYHSVADYRATLDKIEAILQEYDVRILVSGHGDPTSNPDEMHQRLGDARRYLDALEASVRQQQPFDLEGLFTCYRFPGVMRRFHAENVILMERHVAQYPNPSTGLS
ncbi:glyoxylase-like metal-dependent hydrolase (beta-lactamase superfamily II) [Lewinella marina]|uniref:Hydrolase glyoxylase n=1 Tax=Neolewinella marina TaxID=438751 RepID=A0A2G0CJW6_9BACT|nr:MBL fold metallo-hydrolase [Neolewinella marina]NJB84602.1 glyoxylase-like metal-dependent hydrolase (beta-lactamase superfamily II) [Neolewinella marina]PHL00221.1 hydrolase glyoxylase [Neolewinella marina]